MSKNESKYESDEVIYRLLKLLTELNGQMKTIKIKGELKISDEEYERIRILAKRCGYVKISSGNIALTITPEGSKFILQYEKDKREKNIVRIQILTAFTLAFSAFIVLWTGFIQQDIKNNEIYLTYPHFGISVMCPMYLGESFYEPKIVTSIENYGNYAAEYKLIISVDKNITFNYGKNNFSNPLIERYILPKEKSPLREIYVTYLKEKNDNFTYTISYECSINIPNKSEIYCNFWTAKKSICKYILQEGYSKVWKLNQIYE